LQLRQRLRAPAQVRARGQDTETRARSIDERPVVVSELGRQRERVRADNADLRRPESGGVLLELPRASGVFLDGGDLSGKLRRLAARRGAEIESPVAAVRLHDEAGELRAAALRPDASRSDGVVIHPLDAISAGDVGRLTVDLST